MKNFAIVAPSFWLRGSGKKLRGNSNAQVLALYFMTGPAATMIGMYYQPLTTILHETGLSREAFDRALPAVAEIARYDLEAELVWLPEGAAWQIGERMKEGDKRLKGVLRELDMFGEHPFATEFVRKYEIAYGLAGHALLAVEPAAKPLTSPLQAPSVISEAPSKGLGMGMDLGSGSGSGSDAREPEAAPLVERAKLWKRDPTTASMRFPNPESWPELRGLCDLLAAIFGGHPEYPRNSGDPRCRVVLERLASDIQLSRLTAAIRGSKHVDYIREKPESQTLMTILRDDAQVDKFAKFAPAPAVPLAPVRVARPDFSRPPEPKPKPLDPEVQRMLAEAQDKLARRPRLAMAPAPDPDGDRPTEAIVEPASGVIGG